MQLVTDMVAFWLLRFTNTGKRTGVVQFRTGSNPKAMISSHWIWLSSFVRDFGFLHCVIMCYVVEVSDEVVVSICRVGVVKVCRLHRHEFRQTHFTVYGASVTPLCCFSVFSVVFRRVSGLWSPITGLGDHTRLDIPHLVGLLWTSDQPDVETSDNTQHSTRDRHPNPLLVSNPQSQQASGRRPTP
jgi:hypothetical protein